MTLREQHLRDIENSKTSKLVIYACNNGDGMIINDNNMQFFGEVIKIENGEITVV